jgi:hypothetical protein
VKPDNLKIVTYVHCYNVHLEVLQCILKSFNFVCWKISKFGM